MDPSHNDHITTSKGKEIIKYGCVTHPAIALARLMQDNGRVIPVTHVRKEDATPVKNLLAQYPNIDLEAIYSEKDQGDVITLRFIDQNNRLEKQTAFMPPISPEDMEPLLDCDIFVGRSDLRLRSTAGDLTLYQGAC